MVSFWFTTTTYGASATTQPVPTLQLNVSKTAWGEADQHDVEAVLRSTGRELLQYFPGAKLEPINVIHGGPITLFERSREGAIIVKLDCADSYWSQYAFQFGHELCHILCRFAEHERSNLWFEESLCETSSLFVLRRMSQTWKSDAPYKSWRCTAPHLAAYAQERIGKRHLPEGKTLAAWYAENAEALAKNGEDRDKNRVVAAALLPLFEAEPTHWSAVWHLNDAWPEGKQTFGDYLQRWQDQCNPEDRPFVARVAREFGVVLRSLEKRR